MSKRAVWYWQSDNGWVKYDDKICAELEIGLVAKQKRVRVDKDRFVDLENMLQHRYDDESKRRGVKRELEDAPGIFENDIFLLVGGCGTDRRGEKLTKEVEAGGGLVAAHMHPKVTAIVCTSADLKNAATLAQLQSLLQIRQLPVLSPEFIYDSIAEEKRLDPAAYTQTVPAASLSPLPPAGTPAPALATTDPFVVGSEWSGISLTPYDCELHVKSVNGNKWEGTMLWPTLGPTCTKVEGEIGPGPDEVKWMEVDYVDGDDVELKSEYTGNLSGNTLSGTFVDIHKAQGKFSLDVAKAT